MYTISMYPLFLLDVSFFNAKASFSIIIRNPFPLLTFQLSAFNRHIERQ